MSMTTISCRLFAVVGGFLALAGVVAAQELDDWPRTFTGQPDFVFTKDEVLKLNKERAENGEEVRSEQVSWSEVLDAEDIHPFRQARKPDAEGEADTNQMEPVMTSVNQGLAIEKVDLPDTEAADDFNLDSFKADLAETLYKEAVSSPILRDEINPMAVLKKIRVQSIVTSPLTYVQINGRKLAEGDTFYMPLHLMRSYIPVEKAAKLAAPRFQDETLQQEVDAAVLDALKAHKIQRASNPTPFMVKHNVGVKVVKIESRKVSVEVLGKVYPVGINYVF